MTCSSLLVPTTPQSIFSIQIVFVFLVEFVFVKVFYKIKRTILTIKFYQFLTLYYKLCSNPTHLTGLSNVLSKLL